MDHREGPIVSVEEFTELYGWKPSSIKIVCPTCRGEGSHVNPAIDSHGISSEEFAEDPDFEAAYFGGLYDVTCHECEGKNVVDDVDLSALTEEQLEEWREYVQGVYEWRAEIAAERRAGC